MSPKAKEKRAPVPTRPPNYETLGVTRWGAGGPDERHGLGDHDMVPIEGPEGDWSNAPPSETDYRRLVCAEPKCGHVATEGREHQDDAVVIPTDIG